MVCNFVTVFGMPPAIYPAEIEKRGCDQAGGYEIYFGVSSRFETLPGKFKCSLRLSQKYKGSVCRTDRGLELLSI